jgi:hypothetical protein
MRITDLRAGMRVVCVDNNDAEGIVLKFETYVVREVSHRGALVKLVGVHETLASNRFVPAGSPMSSGEMDVTYASN